MTLLELSDVRKAFGGIHALTGADLAVESATIHGLVGPNGAGKSTLMKVAAGEVTPDAGTVSVDGKPLELSSPNEAQAHGIVAMPQELTVAGVMTVEENIVLGAEPRRGPFIDRTRRSHAVGDVLERLGLDLDPRAPVSHLRPSEQRMVMFAHALHRNARVMILDEPTAAMSLEEARTVLGAVRTLRDRGVAVVYVSHRLDEILQLCDTVTTMRDGATVSTVPRSALSKEALVAALLGSAAVAPGERVAPTELRSICTVRGLEATELRGVDLDIHAGEVLGVAGLPGSGAGELLAALAGKVPSDGSIAVDGRDLRIRAPADALAAGISYLPGERHDAGFLDLPLRINVLASHLGAVAQAGLTLKRWERTLTQRLLGDVSVDPRTEAPLSSMSGGNQQRALVARSIAAESRVIVLDDPMAGVDIGARAGLRDLMVRLAREGRAVVVGASEPEELALFADRVVVLARGRIAAVLEGDSLTPSAVLQATISDELHEAAA